MSRAAFNKIKLFYICAREDSALAGELEKHLTLLRRQSLIESWHPGYVQPGADADQEIAQRIAAADIILLLISADFLASSSCYDVQMASALARHHAGSALVIPILLRSVDYTGAPFSALRSLPDDATPVASHDNRDEAWTEVARGLRSAILARFLVREYPEVFQGRPQLLRRPPLLLVFAVVLGLVASALALGALLSSRRRHEPRALPPAGRPR